MIRQIFDINVAAMPSLLVILLGLSSGVLFCSHLSASY
jgi:hypothetical protein